MKIIVSHPTGNANLRAVIKALEENNLLDEFETTINVNPKSNYLKLLPESIAREFLRRQFPVSPHLIKSHPLRELARLSFPRIGLSFFTRHELGSMSVDAVYRNLDHMVSKRIQSISKVRDINAVYAYEDGALNTFSISKSLEIKCFYDLPIGYWRASRELMQAELKNRPDWAKTFTGFKDSDEKLKRKDEELALADHIFVASTFTKNTLEYYQGKLAPVSVIPYGFPEVTENRQYIPLKGRALKLLFVGGLSQRKGIANILEAVEELGNSVELTIIGRKPVEDCEPLNEGLKKHKYIPGLPHHEILKAMKEQDVLLFPSLFEGFGLVVTEAMSQGTAVITTERTCGPDLISHGENGWIIEAGNTEALIKAIENILSRPELIESTGRAALETAKKRPWTKYGEELFNKINDLSLQA